jgi:hypothetical protein
MTGLSRRVRSPGVVVSRILFARDPKRKSSFFTSIVGLKMHHFFLTVVPGGRVDDMFLCGFHLPEQTKHVRNVEPRQILLLALKQSLLTHDRRLQVEEDGPGHVFTRRCLAKEGVEGVVGHAEGVIAGHLTVGLNSMLENEFQLINYDFFSLWRT